MTRLFMTQACQNYDPEKPTAVSGVYQVPRVAVYFLWTTISPQKLFVSVF